MEMLIIFIVLTILNVVIQTIKSIATIKCGKWAAALVNAVAYGLYTYVIFFTSADGIDLHAKALITAFANLVGVYVVKYFEEKARKDKLWKVEATVPVEHCIHLHADLMDKGIAHNYIDRVGKYTIFNIYCPTQAESIEVRQVLESKNAKYFVSESKTL
jgi:uncharacterized protein YebE (UPF0316 family)